MIIKFNNIQYRSINTLIPTYKIKKIPLSLDFKYKHVITFRQKVNARIKILNNLIPNEYKLSDYLLFNCLYFDNNSTIQTRFRNVEIQQLKIMNIGYDLLKIRLFIKNWENEVNVSIKSHDDNAIFSVDSFDLLSIKKTDYNNYYIRNQFINQFISEIDSKDELTRLKFGSTLKIVKIEESSRHKVLPMIIGFIHLQYGLNKAIEFVDEFIINGKYSDKKKYKHKGFLELVNDRRMQVY